MKLNKIVDYLKKFSVNKKSEKKVLFVILGEYIPWYIMHVTVFSKTISKLGYSVDYFSGNRNNQKINDIYKFNANKFIYIDKIKLLVKYSFQIFLLNLKYFKYYFNMDKLVKLKINGIYVGDLIYDDYNRREEVSTIDKVNYKYFLKVNEAYFYYIFYTELFNNNKYEFIVTNHNIYIRNGVLGRVAEIFGIKVLLHMTTEAGFFLRKQYGGDNNVNIFYSILNKKLFYKSLKDTTLMNMANKFFYDVMNKKEETCDKINFNVSSTNTDQNEMKKLEDFKKSSEKKIVVIAAHVMIDNITGADGRRQVYKDVYTWLEETLKLCSSNQNILTYLKPHPREYAFKYTPTILDIFHKLNLDNVYIWPDKINIKENYHLVDTFITIRGSVSFEFPCFGIPVITAGRDHAGSSGFGTTIEVDKVDEYENIIANIHNLKRLDEDTIYKAKLVYFMYYKTFVYYLDEKYMPKMTETYKEEYINVDPKLLPSNPYHDDSVDVLLNKFKLFEEEFEKIYFEEIEEFFRRDDIERLSEIQYEKRYLSNHKHNR